MESNVAIAAPFIPYFGMNSIFNVIAKNAKNKPRNKTVL